MSAQTNVPRRKNLRLSEYDYAQPGTYFVTVCTNSRRCLMGEINEDGVSSLSRIGQVVFNCWVSIPAHFQNVELDQFVIMPNHVHGILHILERRHSLRSIVGGVKAAASRIANEANLLTEPLWQRGYFDHIVRSERALGLIRQYVLDNPQKWALDELNPLNAVLAATSFDNPADW